MSTTPDEALQMVTDCKARESRLSEWGAEFVDSIRRQLERLLSAVDQIENGNERVVPKLLGFGSAEEYAAMLAAASKEQT